MGDNATDTTAAWRDFCRRLEAMGDRLLADDFLADETTRAEGYRYLTRAIRLSTELFLEHGDPQYPHFVNHERPTQQWGGPNPDNFYLRAAIDPNETYRVWADVRGVEQAIFSLMEGDMHLNKYGVFGEVSLDELSVGTDGRLEIFVSPNAHDGNWMLMNPAAQNLTIRLYQSDWGNDAAPYFHIERVGAETASRPAPSPEQVVAGLEASISWVEAAVPYWAAYLQDAANTRPPNELSAPQSPPGGADNISYGGGMWDLAPDEALLIVCDEPDANYWNFTMHTTPFFESGDFGQHQTSINHRQAVVDADGKVRLVVAHVDPGVPNWIDTEGRASAMITYRLLWARSKPRPTSSVIPVADVRAHVPADHPTVRPPERQAMLATRAEQIRDRFR